MLKSKTMVCIKY